MHRLIWHCQARLGISTLQRQLGGMAEQASPQEVYPTALPGHVNQQNSVKEQTSWLMRKP